MFSVSHFVFSFSLCFTLCYYRLLQVTTGYYKWPQIKQFAASYSLKIYRGCSIEEYLVKKFTNLLLSPSALPPPSHCHPLGYCHFKVSSSDLLFCPPPTSSSILLRSQSKIILCFLITSKFHQTWKHSAPRLLNYEHNWHKLHCLLGRSISCKVLVRQHKQPVQTGQLREAAPEEKAQK